MSEIHNAKIVFLKYFIANFEANFLKTREENADYKFAPNDMTIICYRVYLRDGEIDHLKLYSEISVAKCIAYQMYCNVSFILYSKNQM